MRILVIFLGLLLLCAATAVQSSSPTILFWHHYADPARAQTWQTLAEDFNAAHSITVTVQYFPSYNNQQDAILSGLVNGNVPDVALVRNTDAALYQLSNALVDLTPYVQADLDSSVFYPFIWEQDMFHGQRLGLPLTRSAEALYINMDALRELGYTIPPQTRQEWGEMACAFREAGGWQNVQRSATSTGFDVRLDASFWLAFSQPWEVYPNAVFEFNQPALKNSLAFIQDLLKSNCVAVTPAGAQNRFASGQTLFYLDSSGAHPYVSAAIGDFFALPFELAVVPIPAEKGTVSNWYGASLSLFHSHPDQEAAAWAWMLWLAQPEQMARWAESSQALPARLDVVPAADWQPFLAATPYNEPNLAGYDLIRDELSFAVRGILEGEDVNQRLQNLTETANRIALAFALE